MARYIDAEKAVEEARLSYCKDCDSYNGVKCRACGFDDAMMYIEDAPEADVVEVKHGKWNVEESKEHFNVVCSSCNKDFYVYKKGQYRIQCSNYCPNCGARMDGDT